MSTSARIAPDWITTLNSSERSPSHCSAMSRCPVLETGRNSVMPSMRPRMTVLMLSDTGLPRVQMTGRHLNRPAFGTGRASQLVAQVLKRKARQRDIAAARERHDLEGLAHLLGHDEAACLAREARALHGVVGLGYEALETQGEEKRRLGGESTHREIGGEPRVRDPREVDPRGDVLDPDLDAKVIVRALLEMTAQRAAHPLRMVVMRARQAVVAQQQHAAPETLAQGGDPGRDPQADLGGVALRKRRGQGRPELAARLRH